MYIYIYIFAICNSFSRSINLQPFGKGWTSFMKNPLENFLLI